MASDSPGSYKYHHHQMHEDQGHALHGSFLQGPNGTRLPYGSTAPHGVYGSPAFGVISGSGNVVGSERLSGIGSGGGAGGGGGTFGKDSGYYVSTSDGASTCSSSTNEAGEADGAGGTLLVLEPKSLRSFTTNDEYLYAMKEDLADWFSCLYKNDVTAENFFNILETGVLLCQHANKVRDFAKQRREKGEALEMRSYFIRSVPEASVPFREGVKPETFQARDNVSNFISWSRNMGIPDVLSFETDDLVLRKNEKSVILCLLEIARVGAKLGMLAPTLVQMEQEIDAELAGEEPRPQVQIKTCDMRSLDERVRDLIGRCTCPVQFPMIKVGEGKYKIGDSRSLIFVRILRNHVMVRVGGGWDTLENYLNKHDPCQCNYRGHRAGSAQPAIAHKVSVGQQRRASMPGQNVNRPAPNTPTSPRRSSNVVPPHARSTSPQSRSKSPTLVISRQMPLKSGGRGGGVTGQGAGSSLSSGNAQGGRTTPSQLSSHGNSSNSPGNYNQSSLSSQQARCKSPSPSRMRSPSPRTTPQSATSRPSVLRTSSSSSLLKGIGHGHEGKTSALRRGDKGTFNSDIEDEMEGDEEGNHRFLAIENGHWSEPVADQRSPRHQQYDTQSELGQGSVSFDERAEFPADARSAPDTEGQEGGGKANVSMDKISTMTLREFKSLLNSALTVPEQEQQQQNGEVSSQTRIGASNLNGGGEPVNRQLNWDSLRDKARSVRDSISSSVNARKGSSGGGGVVDSSAGRRSLPQSPMDDKPRPLPGDRPKTPVALRRNANNSTPSTPPRPKTPTSSVSRPKTPTSSGGYRPKTPSSLDRDGGEREEYKMSRPKTPSQMKRDAVAKVAGAISNWVESRQEIDSGSTHNRPKTPTRPKTPVGSKSYAPRCRSRAGMDEEDVDDDEDDDDDNDEIVGVLANPHMQSLASTVKERPATPSRIPKPCFTPRPVTPKVSSTTDVTQDGMGNGGGQFSQSHFTPSSSSSANQLLSSSSSSTSSTPAASSQCHQKISPSTTRPAFISRSNSNSSSVRSSEDAPPSSAYIHPEDRSFAVSSLSKSSQNKPVNVISRKCQPTNGFNNTSNSSNQNVNSKTSPAKSYRDLHAVRRSVTPGPYNSKKPQPARSVTPGPYERRTMAERASTRPAHDELNSRRRGSLTNPAPILKSGPGKRSSSAAPMRRASSTANIDQQQMLLTNEITFSDDEEINELVMNAAKMKAAQALEKRERSSSVDARKLAHQNGQDEKDGEVLMVRRDSSGHHGVQVMKQNEMRYDSTTRVNVVKRPPSRGSSTDRANSTASSAARFRSQTPDPSMFRQKMGVSKAKESSDADMNRTEAWVDSTLSDPKRKPPTRAKRGKVVGKEIPASELVPRPLEEIKAILTEPQNGLSHLDTCKLDAPPEDPEMYRKMERLFEKYREMELRASVNDTPGGGPAEAKSKPGDGNSVKAGSQRSTNASSRSTPSVASLKTSTGSHSSSSGISANTPPSNGHGVASQPPSVKSSSSDDQNRFRRSSSVPGSFQQQLHHRAKNTSSNNGSAASTPGHETREFPHGDGEEFPRRRPPSRQGSDVGSSTESKGRKASSLKDIDTEVAKDPTALISKIKEILRVRPRKDENSKVPTRIPAPAALSKKTRSKSVSNLFSSEGVPRRESAGSSCGFGRELSLRQSNGSDELVDDHDSLGVDVANRLNRSSRANSTSSGNIAYSEFVFTDEKADEVGELTRAWSVQSDSSDGNNRSETPVPKLATPLTTGRSTFINRKGDHLTRGLSQEKENNLSNSQSSLSSRSVLSAAEDDGDYV